MKAMILERFVINFITWIQKQVISYWRRMLTIKYKWVKSAFEGTANVKFEMKCRHLTKNVQKNISDREKWKKTFNCSNTFNVGKALFSTMPENCRIKVALTGCNFLQSQIFLCKYYSNLRCKNITNIHSCRFSWTCKKNYEAIDRRSMNVKVNRLTKFSSIWWLDRHAFINALYV